MEVNTSHNYHNINKGKRGGGGRERGREGESEGYREGERY
jgi:hypothetical protein